MTENEFTREVAKAIPLSMITTRQLIKSFTKTVTSMLQKNDIARFDKFATFFLIKRPSLIRYDVNSRTTRLMPYRLVIKMRMHGAIFNYLNPGANPNVSSTSNESFKKNRVRATMNLSRDKDKIITNYFLASLFSNITRLTLQGHIVKINNLGTFDIAIYQGRTGRNPRTGAQIAIKRRYKLRFIPSDTLKKIIN
jgi:DNA-binding protein HU-beta